MEEDIKILEEMITWDCLLPNKKQTEAIENLIKGYRELEEQIDKHVYFETTNPKEIEKNYIPKSKIKEKIEPVIDSLEENDFVGYADELRDIMSELMEDK